MKEIDTIASIKNDIYSFVLDSSFTSQKEFFNALDHAYHYTLLAAYPEIEGKLVLQEEATKKANSAILGYNEKVSREFDPVYDRAILEARKYKAKMAQIAKIEEQLDAKMFSPKDLVYQELGKIDEVLTFTKPDEYKVPLDEIFDGPYVEKKPKVVEEVVVKVPSVQDALLSLDKLSPSVLSIDNFIDYVMSRKEMVSLTIDLSQNYKKEPTTMKIFEASYFALIFETAPSFVIDLKLDLSYVDELRKKHPHIVHILNGSQDDWYMLVMDETFSSYEELYDIALTSYRYTKAIYYKNREADQDAASAA
jgi:predicted DNA-binding protein (MmcQ/YjbR family)